MLRETTPPDFLDSSVEWRRIFSEIWGTFLLVVMAAGADVVGAKSGGAVTLGMAVVAPGMMVIFRLRQNSIPNLRDSWFARVGSTVVLSVFRRFGAYPTIQRSASLAWLLS